MSAQQTPCACTTLRKASRAVTRFYDEALRSTDLTSTQFAVMRAVAREEKVPMSRVASTLVMDRTTFYRAIAPLLRAGDLKWVPSRDDGRAKLLELSPSGRRRMDRAAGKWAAAQRRMVRKIGLARWRELSRWLQQTTNDALALEPLETGSLRRGRER
jgi:DNA-binding MarR family transcriptional regulator